MSRPALLACTAAALSLAIAAMLTLLGEGPALREPTPAELDRMQAHALAIELRVDDREQVGGRAPVIADASAPSLAELSCLVVSPTPDGSGRVMTLPPGGALVEAAPHAPALLRLRRFEEAGFPVAVGRVAGGDRGVIEIPVDGVSRPWQLEVRSAAMLSVCGRGAR